MRWDFVCGRLCLYLHDAGHGYDYECGVYASLTFCHRPLVLRLRHLYLKHLNRSRTKSHWMSRRMIRREQLEGGICNRLV